MNLFLAIMILSSNGRLDDEPNIFLVAPHKGFCGDMAKIMRHDGTQVNLYFGEKETLNHG
jgi:hypothetical protein